MSEFVQREVEQDTRLMDILEEYQQDLINRIKEISKILGDE